MTADRFDFRGWRLVPVVNTDTAVTVSPADTERLLLDPSTPAEVRDAWLLVTEWIAASVDLLLDGPNR
jgi:hypothetical protein